MKPIHFLCAALVLLCANLPAMAQPSPDDSDDFASAMSANFCFGQLFGTNACVARCDWNVLSDDFKEYSTQGFAVLDGMTRQEIDMSEFKNQMAPPAAMKMLGVDQQVYILRPDLKVNYIIYPRLKCYLKQQFSAEEAAALSKKPTMAKTELGKEEVNGHSCMKTKVVITAGDGRKWEMFVWFAADLRNFPMRIQLTEENSSTIEVYTFKDIHFIKPDPKLFKPPPGFTKYPDFDTMMDKTQPQGIADLANTNANFVQIDRLAPIIDFTLQNGTNRSIGPKTAKALGLGTQKIPTMQILIGSKDDPIIHQFGVSLQNTNDLIVARIDLKTHTGIMWLTSPSGVIRATILTSTNGPLKSAPPGRNVNEYGQEIGALLDFVAAPTPETAAGPPPWIDAPHPLNVVAMFGGVPDVEKIFKRDPGAINTQDDDGMTPLAGAVVQEQMDVVRFLLDNGADPNIPNKNGLTPLEHACGRDKTNALVLAKLLLAKGALVNPTNITEYPIPPLDWAISSDNLDLVKLLLKHGATIKVSYLASAADRGDVEIAEILIAHGADVNATNADGSTALHNAAWSGQEEIVKLLLSKGAHPDPKRSDGLTPLINAAGPGAESHGKACVELLLAKGANVNATDGNGETALHKAAYYGNKDVIEILLTHGASINATNKNGKTPLQVASKPEIAELLRQHGAK